MSYHLDIGAAVDINLSVGLDEDYTFSSSAPSVLTVDADGVVTGVSSGLAAVVIVRNEDSITVGSVLFYVVDPAAPPVGSLPPILVTPTALPSLVFEAEQTSPTQLSFTWSGLTVLGSFADSSSGDVRLTTGLAFWDTAGMGGSLLGTTTPATSSGSVSITVSESSSYTIDLKFYNSDYNSVSSTRATVEDVEFLRPSLFTEASGNGRLDFSWTDVFLPDEIEGFVPSHLRLTATDASFSPTTLFVLDYALNTLNLGVDSKTLSGIQSASFFMHLDLLSKTGATVNASLRQASAPFNHSGPNQVIPGWGVTVSPWQRRTDTALFFNTAIFDDTELGGQIPTHVRLEVTSGPRTGWTLDTPVVAATLGTYGEQHGLEVSGGQIVTDFEFDLDETNVFQHRMVVKSGATTLAQSSLLPIGNVNDSDYLTFTSSLSLTLPAESFDAEYETDNGSFYYNNITLSWQGLDLGILGSNPTYEPWEIELYDTAGPFTEIVGGNIFSGSFYSNSVAYGNSSFFDTSNGPTFGIGARTLIVPETEYQFAIRVIYRDPLDTEQFAYGPPVLATNTVTVPLGAPGWGE